MNFAEAALSEKTEQQVTLIQNRMIVKSESIDVCTHLAQYFNNEFQGHRQTQKFRGTENAATAQRLAIA